jgi:serine acetyltransferase
MRPRPMKLREFRAALKADLACNTMPLDKLSVFTFRLGQYAAGSRNLLLRAVWRPLDFFYLRLLIGAELPPEIGAGPGLRLPHAGRGIIIHPHVRIGSGVTLLHRVTIGEHRHGVPVIGDGVFVGAGAVVIGGIKVGNQAQVGAGAVVLCDVPDGCTAVGVPASVAARSVQRPVTPG